MIFEWDDEKNRINLEKHGIDFETAAYVFGDENRIEKYDDLHSDFEDRYITIGMISETLCVLTVVYTERKEIIRMISARKASAIERKEYYDRKKRN